MAADEKSIVVVKTSLAKILRNPQHLAIYQDSVNIVNCLVTTAYLFARYIFVHAYEEDENDENDNDAFSTDVFMTDAFFSELLPSLQTRTHRASKDENTLRNRQLIDKYITNLCALSRFQQITILGIASNVEAYIARQMLTAYINNAEMRSGTHLQSCLNFFFDVRALQSTLRCQTTMTADKQLAHAYLADISSFKTILSSTESYDALEGRVNEIQTLGEEYFFNF